MGETLTIAYLAASDTGNGFYRGTAPMTALEARGHRVVRLPTSGAVDGATLQAADLLLVHRYVDERTLKIVRAAKEHGAAVVWDNDDDAGEIPRGTVAHRKYGGINWQKTVMGMRKVFALADLVTAPSAHLVQRFADAGAKRTALIENFPPSEFLQRGDRPHTGTVVGWVAGLEHQIDAEHLGLRPVFDRLLADCPHLRLASVGLKLGVSSERYTHIGGAPLMRLTETASAFDVGIAPLADIGFNRARSSIKLKEYAAAGLPWLASPTGPYAEMGEKQGGRLVADDRWYEEIRRLVEKPRDRRKLQKRARKWVEGETLERNAHRWEELFLETVERRRAARARG